MIIGTVTTETWRSYRACAPRPQTDKTLGMTSSEDEKTQVAVKSLLIQSDNSLTVRGKLENNIQAQVLFPRYVLKFIHDRFGDLWGASFNTQSV